MTSPSLTPPPASPEPPFSVRLPFLIGVEGTTRLTLIRHGQQDYPVSDEFDHAAWADPPLSGLGRTQAMAVAAALGEEKIDVVACSTMERAVETARIVASPHGLTPLIRPELVEVQSYRDLPEGANPQELISPEEWQQHEDLFRREVMWDHMFFTEGSAEFRERVLPAIARLMAEYEGRHIALVSHGGVINALLGDILGIREDMWFLPYHCSISTVVAKGDVRRVHTVNEHEHLHIGILTN